MQEVGDVGGEAGAGVGVGNQADVFEVPAEDWIFVLLVTDVRCRRAEVREGSGGDSDWGQ